MAQVTGSENITSDEQSAQTARVAEPENNPPSSTNASFRGPLKYEVETSSSQLEAGKEFSFFVRITNPYDVPVEIKLVRTEVPIEFIDAEGKIPALFESFKYAFDQGRKEAMEERDRKARRVDGVSLSVSKDILEQREASGESPSTVVLQPGNTGLSEFELRTKRWLLFTPSVLNIHIQIKYEMNGVINHDTVKHQLSIRAPLKALIWGSFVGAYIGTLLRSLYEGAILTYRPQMSFIVALISGILLGGVLVIAFARKKEAQPFISIEDFWGGFFVGFLAGYVGRSLLDTVLVTTQS